MKKITFLMAVFLSNMPMQAFFYNCAVLYNTKTGQRVFALGDVHLDRPDKKITCKQRADLIAILQDCAAKGESTHCLVEDAWYEYMDYLKAKYGQDRLKELQMVLDGDFDDLGTAGAAMVEKVFHYFERELRVDKHNEQLRWGSPMDVLVKHAHALGLPAINIDPRDIPFNISYKNDDYKVENNLEHLSEKERKGIHGLYTIMIAKTAQGIKNQEIKERLLDFMYSYYSISDMTGLDEAASFMVDIAAIDNIYENKNIKNLFLCAGAAHTRRVVAFLQSTGDYQQIDFVGCDGENFRFRDKMNILIPSLKDVVNAIPNNTVSAKVIKAIVSKAMHVMLKDEYMTGMAIDVPKAIADGLKAERTYLTRKDEALNTRAQSKLDASV
ncbi:MAG TPA: hypothetical protein VGT41_03600 [Candidatus Babeliales bacterium]|nr:hypothetical protein [Candidatus Babeliales bacterium]